MGTRRIPTVLVGRNALLREGLAHILKGTDLRIDQSVTTVEELQAESLSRHEAPLLVIECGDRIDVTVGEIERFKLHHPHGRVAVLAGNCRGDNLISLFEAGTNVFLAKSISREVFVRALELVTLGETFLPGELLAYLRPGKAHQPARSGEVEYVAQDAEVSDSDDTPPLSARERSILLCLVQGESNKVVARRIGIAESTVKVHVKTILRKLRARNRTQAAIWAMNNKICDMTDIKLLPETQLMSDTGDRDEPGEGACSLDDTVEPLLFHKNPAARAANGRRH